MTVQSTAYVPCENVLANPNISMPTPAPSVPTIVDIFLPYRSLITPHNTEVQNWAPQKEAASIPAW